MFCISIIDHHLVISLQFKIDIARESRAISVFTCSDITRDRCPLYQIVNDTSKIDSGYQLFQPVFGYNTRYHLTISREEMYSQRYRPWMPKGHSRWISLERKRDSRLEVCFSARTKRAREPSERGPGREADWQPRVEVPFVWVEHRER